MRSKNMCLGIPNGTSAPTTKSSPEDPEGVRRVHVENRDQAQALANFLWNEEQRHYQDIAVIARDLNILFFKWDVMPSKDLQFVEP
jgi:hypothetical protein